VVMGDRIYVASGDGYEVAEYGRDGVERLIRTDRAPLPVHKRDIEDYRRSLIVLGGEGSAQLRRDEQRLLAGIRYPRTMPPIADLAADANGRLWVKEGSRPGDVEPEMWTVFAPSGEAMGTVRVPRNLRVTQIGRDWLLGIAIDADRLEHVRLYRLRPR